MIESLFFYLQFMHNECIWEACECVFFVFSSVFCAFFLLFFC